MKYPSREVLDNAVDRLAEDHARESGFYAVRLEAGEDWGPAEYDAVTGRWTVLGNLGQPTSDEIHEIGPRIEMPASGAARNEAGNG